MRHRRDALGRHCECAAWLGKLSRVRVRLYHDQRLLRKQYLLARCLVQVIDLAHIGRDEGMESVKFLGSV